MARRPTRLCEVGVLDRSGNDLRPFQSGGGTASRPLHTGPLTGGTLARPAAPGPTHGTFFVRKKTAGPVQADKPLRYQAISSAGLAAGFEHRRVLRLRFYNRRSRHVHPSRNSLSGGRSRVSGCPVIDVTAQASGCSRRRAGAFSAASRLAGRALWHPSRFQPVARPCRVSPIVPGARQCFRNRFEPEVPSIVEPR